MNKEIITSLVSALKTLKNTMIEHNRTFRNYLDIRSMFTMNRILYQGEKFNKLTEDIKFLMERSLNQKNFELYVKNSDKMIKNILQREEALNEQVEKAISDCQVGLEDLKERLDEFDYLLDEINNSFD